MKNNDINVLIPFRNREDHLKELIPKLRESLALLDLKPLFIVSEQTDSHLFNKGSIWNAGFKEASKITDCEYWVFHDVDVFEVKPGVFHYCQAEGGICNIYSCYGKGPGGGVFAIDSHSFKEVNGYTNQFWHWGREDADFMARVKHKKIPILHQEFNQARRRPGNPNNLVKDIRSPDSDNRLHKTPEYQTKLSYVLENKYRDIPSSVMDDGLNNVKYELINKEMIESDIVKFTFHLSQ